MVIKKFSSYQERAGQLYHPESSWKCRFGGISFSLLPEPRPHFNSVRVSATVSRAPRAVARKYVNINFIWLRKDCGKLREIIIIGQTTYGMRESNNYTCKLRDRWRMVGSNNYNLRDGGRRCGSNNYKLRDLSDTLYNGGGMNIYDTSNSFHWLHRNFTHIGLFQSIFSGLNIISF